ALKFGPLLGVDDPPGDLTNSYNLGPSYPNPFNSATTIGYQIPKAEFVNISVCNINGQVVATLVNQQMPAGNHTVQWSALDLESGVYFYRMKAGDYSTVKKTVLLK
ncbi:MAG: T9SS type A sorting domain-containing protein, partial [Bacteroidia bacterium]|nr:T9SS type A sorting domain-containing protein [Bacteroidia bacterium]